VLLDTSSAIDRGDVAAWILLNLSQHSILSIMIFYDSDCKSIMASMMPSTGGFSRIISVGLNKYAVGGQLRV
jgi:hypothetical protein